MNSIFEELNKIDDDRSLTEFFDDVEDMEEAAGEEFYRNAEKELEARFGCKNALLEPSTQYGQGRTFLFADDMSFDGSFDFQTGEDFVRDNNFEGFLQLCFDSFTPKMNELNESVTKKSLVDFLKANQQSVLTEQEFKTLVNNLWSAIKREVSEGADYESIWDVDVFELIDGSDNPTHNLGHKLLGLEVDEELNESSEKCTDVQYGVHRFSTDSIIFRGTEEECIKFIDDRDWLWDDAEVYWMTPDDPHYIKDCSDLED